jgi:RNase H-like domain found in reverse transcriptase
MPENKIYVITDASNTCSGALLLFGPSWETARPVAFKSTIFKGAELNYPIHKKELLAIIRALKKWCTDLVGSTFLVFTDHKTLENFSPNTTLTSFMSRANKTLLQTHYHVDQKIVPHELVYKLRRTLNNPIQLH